MGNPIGQSIINGQRKPEMVGQARQERRSGGQENYKEY